MTLSHDISIINIVLVYYCYLLLLLVYDLCIICTLVGRFLLSFEKCSKNEGKKASSNAAKARVRSKGRRQILNGPGSRHGPVLIKKKKVAKYELSSSQELDSVPPADVGGDVVNKNLCAESIPDAEKCSSGLSLNDEDSKTGVLQIDQTTRPTSTVRYSFVLAVLIT